MGRAAKRHGGDGNGRAPQDKDLNAGSEDIPRRQTAASYLREARLTDDPAQRESLRRMAAELLAPRRNRRKPDGVRDADTGRGSGRKDS